MKIDSAKSELKRINNKYMSKKISKLYVRREHKIENYFNKVCDWMIKEYPEKKCVVIGYNKNWKNRTNMGNINNRRFYEESRRHIRPEQL